MAESGWILFEPLTPAPLRAERAWLQALQQWPGGYQSQFAPTAQFSRTCRLKGGVGLDCLTAYRRAWKPVEGHACLAWQARVGVAGGLTMDSHTMLGEWDLFYELARLCGGEVLLVWTDCGSLQLVSFRSPEAGQLPEVEWASWRLRSARVRQLPALPRDLANSRLPVDHDQLWQSLQSSSIERFDLAKALGMPWEAEEAERKWARLWAWGREFRVQQAGIGVRSLAEAYQQAVRESGLPEHPCWLGGLALRPRAWSDTFLAELEVQLNQGIPLDSTWWAVILALELEAANHHRWVEKVWTALESLPSESTTWSLLAPEAAPPHKDLPCPPPLAPSVLRPLPNWMEEAVLEGAGGADLELDSAQEARQLSLDPENWQGVRVGSHGSRFWMRGGYLPLQRLITCLGDLPLSTLCLQAGAVGYRG